MAQREEERRRTLAEAIAAQEALSASRKQLSPKLRHSEKLPALVLKQKRQHWPPNSRSWIWNPRLSACGRRKNENTERCKLEQSKSVGLK